MARNCLMIEGHPYSIRFIDPEEYEDGDTIAGYHSYEAGEIGIAANIPQGRQQETLLHEVLHSLSDTHGLELNETTIKILATALYGMGCTNPLWEQVMKGEVSHESSIHSGKIPC